MTKEIKTMSASLRASLVLEAMRLGVVPAADLSGYTVGREREAARIEADLDQVERDGGAVRAFLADYGVGKTHLLEHLQHQAAQRNFLTARVVLDAREAAPSHPQRVYRALVRSLRYPERPLEEGAGLRPLLEKAVTNDQARADFEVGTKLAGRSLRERLDDGMHLYLTPALSYFEELTGSNAGPDDAATLALLLDWLEGHPTVSNQDIDSQLSRRMRGSHRIYSLKDYRPWARIYAYLISGIARLANQVGYAGLVILLDEAEFYALLSSENREYARYLFKALSCAAVGTDIVPFEAEELERGGYGILQELPTRHSDRSSLYTVFAMTPNAAGIEILEQAVPPGSITEIAPFAGPQYEELVARICGFYSDASLDWNFPPK
ncbi:MAG: DUF2791 family P-loop domain-containing protein, partial [Bradymonadaceae bacterium]|nr:DUF2791 family P-loop domain-containing protein [Lujinxingiaceae bacterium]